MTQKRAFVVTAYQGRPKISADGRRVTKRPECLHETYVRARGTEDAKRVGQLALRGLPSMRGQRYWISVRPATPEDLGCVPAGSGRVSW